MKATLHIPTGNYAYIEVELDGTTDDIIRKYFELEEQFEARKAEILKEEKPAF